MNFSLKELLLIRSSISKNITRCKKLDDNNEEIQELEELKQKVEKIIDTTKI